MTAVDRKASEFGDGDPRVAIGGVQPAAAIIKRKSRDFFCPGAPADAGRCLKYQRGPFRLRKASCRANAGSATSNNYDVDLCAHR